MTRCVLCFTPWPEKPPQRIRLKPKYAGVRVLTLDGGGIRGIVELAILAQIERRVGLGVPVRDLFDLIVGTSTGKCFQKSVRLVGSTCWRAILDLCSPYI